MVKLYCCVASPVWGWEGGEAAGYLDHCRKAYLVSILKGLFLAKRHHHFRRAEACTGFLLKIPHKRTQEKSNSPSKSCWQSLCDFLRSTVSTLKDFFVVVILLCCNLGRQKTIV